MYLVDATPLQSEHRERGVGTYVRYLATSLLRRESMDIHFALAKNLLDELPTGLRRRSHISWRAHRPAQVYWIYNEIFLRRAIRRCQPEVFHSTDFNGLVTVPGIATVCTLHDIMALKSPVSEPSLSNRLSQLRWNVYFRKLQAATSIIAVSNAVKQDAIERLHIEPSRITTIHPGVDIERFSPDKPPSSHLTVKKYFLCVGAGDPNKNYPRILKAFARVAERDKDITLAIAGRWNPSTMQWLQTEIAALGISHRVEFLGFVSPRELESLYAHALAFIFPSLDEGFGSPLVESMASGCPFVSSNRGALAEVAGTAGLLIDPCDVDSLTKAMEELLKFPRLRSTLAWEGLQRAPHFSWDDVADRTIAVYEEATRIHRMNRETGRRK